METSNAYQSIYDGPSIDEAIARATEGGHIDAAIQAKPNRNLLDNWYFRSPVNQRGAGSYAVSGYTIDRWKTWSNKLTVNVTSDGITLINNDTAQLYFTQYIDGGIPVEDSYTISALVSAISGTAYFQAVYSDGAYGTPLNLAAGCNAITVSASKTISRVLFQVNSGASVTVKAAKLELGSQQTLAHQDADGNWVLNEIPNYADMLARCQAYAERLNIQMQAGFNQSFQYKVTKRATPAVTLISANGVTGKVSYYTGSAWEDVDAASVFSYPAAGNESLVLSDYPVVDGRVYSFTAFIFADL